MASIGVSQRAAKTKRSAMILKSHTVKHGMPQAAEKYQPYPQIDLPNRTWPSKTITAPPIWCSVDLRDGNQSLVDPMGHDRKARMFQLLLDMGFKDIEIAFPPPRRRISTSRAGAWKKETFRRTCPCRFWCSAGRS